VAGGKKQNKNDKRKKDRSEERGKAEERVGKSAATVVVERAVVPEPAAEPAVPVVRGRLTAMVPVRFDAQMLDAVRSRAAEDQRSVSSWIRRAVDHELQRGH